LKLFFANIQTNTLTKQSKAKQIKMPAITRSQSKKQMRQSESVFNTRLKSTLPMPLKKEVQVGSKAESENLITKTPNPDVNSRSSEKRIFVNSIKDKLFISGEYRSRFTLCKHSAEKLPNGPAKDELTAKYKQYYYDNVRILTETYYTIVDWFDRLFLVNGVIASPSFQKLLDRLYEKTFELEISNALPNPTPEEKHIVKVLMDQLHETRTIIAPYVSPTPKAPAAPVVKSATAPRRSARLMNRNNA
jgi:hypothetical protein